ncbi:MAG: septum formation inhibitor Maf [Pegethrix bostrychoides GSE-TBD4-15B]|jgi:septum formation protein|uniref:Nucleoside triphosphate pyrophosphatase n=1 Tax=Pegethrix bostrychoides GSE-TBD4-15B TaxID=2839662 RepID=A0A951PCS6_9CYAN|nr:septum formation inhibitor Maf [Pegethrix bostrychoides GSE-TBD4-15B]
MAIPPLVLASASTARLRLLRTAGIEPVVHPSDFDESQVQLDNPADLVQRLAEGKAAAVAAQLNGMMILGCDSVLVLGGQIYGKPANPAEAIQRWQQMRGQTGALYTGHVLIDQVQRRQLVRYQITEVEFALVSQRQIEAYVATGEPLHCAGCFALEGRGGLFIESIRGCHSNVIGLSLPLLRQMLATLSYDVSDYWHQ